MPRKQVKYVVKNKQGVQPTHLSSHNVYEVWSEYKRSPFSLETLKRRGGGGGGGGGDKVSENIKSQLGLATACDLSHLQHVICHAYSIMTSHAYSL